MSAKSNAPSHGVETTDEIIGRMRGRAEDLRSSAYGRAREVTERDQLPHTIARAAFHFVQAIQFAHDGAFFHAGQYVADAREIARSFYFCREEYERAFSLTCAIENYCCELEARARLLAEQR
jgi:hypothetical protein